MKVEEKNGRKIEKKVFGRRFCLFSGFGGRVFKKIIEKVFEKVFEKVSKIFAAILASTFRIRIVSGKKGESLFAVRNLKHGGHNLSCLQLKKKTAEKSKNKFGRRWCLFSGFSEQGFQTSLEKSFRKSFGAALMRRSALHLVARISSHYWSICFSTTDDICSMWSGLHSLTSLSFWTCSDLFGPVRMHSDAFGCLRMRLDAFGHFQKIFNFLARTRPPPALPPCLAPGLGLVQAFY